MKTIQEIAEQCYVFFNKDYTYNCSFAGIDKVNCPKSLLRLIGYTSDTYLFKFLQFSLDTISKIHESQSTPDEMRLSSDWSEPNFTSWGSSDLWQWLISDFSHLDLVQQHISQVHTLGHNPDLSACIQLAVWDEWTDVFEAVKAYLVEAYNAQPDDEDCDDDEE